MAAAMTGSAETCVARLLDAIAGRDVRRLSDALAADVTWQNVPHAPASGRPAVVALIGELLTWSGHVQWDVVSASYDGPRGWVERVDRFVIDGVEHAVACNGVFVADDEGRLLTVRDYVDLGEWRARVGPALERRRSAPPADVVARHLDAVGRGDVLAMAADYAPDAVLERAGARHTGWVGLLDYFATVPERLAGRPVRFAAPAVRGDTVTVEWTIGDDAAGTDTFVVAAGRIARHLVELHSPDF